MAGDEGTIWPNKKFFFLGEVGGIRFNLENLDDIECCVGIKRNKDRMNLSCEKMCDVLYTI
jgi:hypothetical protein